MPRHPPCALNNEHTNHHTHKHAGGHTSELDKKLIKEKRNHTNTHKQTTKSNPSGVFNARVHYTVLTQHPNHTQPTPTVSTRIMVRHTKRGIMPQTPNNAPTYKQHYFSFNCAWTTVCHKAPFKHSACLLSVCFTRTIFNNKSWQYDTRILNQPRVQLHPKNKSSLERR